MEKGIKMKVENFFLRYAYPCAYIALQRGEITNEELQELEEAAVENKDISREKLEKVFHKAFESIRELAKERNKDIWDEAIIREFFYSYHNKVIEKGEGTYATAPETLKELSKVTDAKVVKKNDDNLLVEYDKKIRCVMNSFVAEAKEGDIVRIHYGYAVEIIE